MKELAIGEIKKIIIIFEINNNNLIHTTMPNHISNILSVSAKTAGEIQNFLNAIKGENTMDSEQQVIDFNAIIPMPMDLRNTESSSYIDDAIYYYLAKNNLVEYNRQKMDRLQKSNKELNELYKIGEKYVGYEKEYGAKDWYDWSRQNWGTKWNAYDSNINIISDSSVEIRFLTAWNGVPELISKLTEMYPELTFEYKFADEDMGYNTGEGYTDADGFTFYYNDNGSDEAMATFAQCWGYDFDEDDEE